MFEFITAGGLMMIPIIIISIIAMAIIAALFISLNSKRVIPEGTTNAARITCYNQDVQHLHK